MIGTTLPTRRPLTALALPLCLMACGGREGGRGSTYEVRDSAGVQIVENRGPLSPSRADPVEGPDGWRVDEMPMSAIEGSGEGVGYVLFQVEDLAFQGEDRVLVGLGASDEILVLDRDGRLLSSMGGTGGGPQQFRNLGGVFPLAPDSVAGYDFPSRSVRVFDPSGNLAREFHLEPEADPLASDEVLATPSGSYYLLRHAQVQFGAEPGTHRISAPSFRLDSEGRRTAELGPFPGRMITSGQFFGILLFSPELVAGCLGEQLVVGTGDAEELRVFEPNGHLSRIIRWPKEERALSPERVEEILSEAVEASPEPVPNAVLQAFLQLPFPEESPPYGHLLVSDTGEIWVGEYWAGEFVMREAPRPEKEWKVFDPSGIWLASVGTPAGFELREVRGDQLLGVYRNGLGVESIRIYRLIRSHSR